MQKGDVILRGFVPTDQDAPEAVQPTVRAFHHPASGLEPRLPFDLLRRLPPTADVGGEPELLQGAAYFTKVIAPVSSTGQAFVQTRTLRPFCAGFRSVHGQAVHRAPCRFHVMAVGPVHRQAHRYARRFGQQAALDAPLPRSVGLAPVFPRPGALWSWRRPCSPNSSPVPSIRHNAPVPPATAPETPQRQPIPESAGGRYPEQMPVASRAFHWQPVRNT